MIIPEDKLDTIISTIPALSFNDRVDTRSPSFGWGDKFELIKYLMKHGDNNYPLIWLLNSKQDHIENDTLCIRKCDFVISTKETRKDLLANERYNLSFKYILNPVADYLVQGVNSSQTTRIMESKFSMTRYVDYSYNENEANPYREQEAFSIDLWDAILLSMEIEFNNLNQNTIKWKQITI